MQILRNRLKTLRKDIAAFRLTVHEMCADPGPVEHRWRVFYDHSPDDPLAASSILYQTAECQQTARFDPLHYVLQSAATLKPVSRQLACTGNLPSYQCGGRTILRRYECQIVFAEDHAARGCYAG